MSLDYGTGSGYTVSMEGPFGSVESSIKTADITILKDSWKGAESPYSQVVAADAVSVNSIIDLQPNMEQIQTLCKLGIALSVENNEGTITVHAFGGKPDVDMVIQATIREVIK